MGFRWDPKAEVYDSEILGRLEVALTSPMDGLIPGIHICIDNLSDAQKGVLYQMDLVMRDLQDSKRQPNVGSSEEEG